MILIEQTFERSLDRLLARFTTGDWTGSRLEAWLFEDHAARQAAEQRLAAAGIQARLRSAYKPLVHFFLEERQHPGSGDVTVRLPTHPGSTAQRFRLEAFPLSGLIAPAALHFTPGDRPLDYIVEQDGESTPVFAPNRERRDHLGQTLLTPCGWLRVWRDPNADKPDEDAPLDTEYEAAFLAAMQAITAHPWGAAMPYFDTLAIEASLAGIERPLGWQDECMSTAEGMHEDFYFSLLEFFQAHAGLKLGDRTLQPGQIAPFIRTVDGAATLRVELRAHAAEPAPPAYTGDLAEADEPLPPATIATALAALGGTPIEHRSVQGRAVIGTLVRGAGRGLVITAGQHANETTGPVGALRAAAELVRQGQAFALIPQENPDGYDMHRRLRRDNPRHMHHAARYTALGDDLQYRSKPPLYEKSARLEALRLTGADLHINLHGYPAHEWNRPLTGYLTRGFEAWSIPKGFYLILRHPPGRSAAAVSFLQQLCAAVAQVPDLATVNAPQLAAWRAHAGELPEPVWHGIPCTIIEHPAAPPGEPAAPYMLITEYPDETIYGAAFRLGHTVQMTTVLAAQRLYCAGALPS